MADWAHLALTVGDINHPDYKGPPTREDLNYMWDTYIAGEFGGANEVFAEVAAITGEAKHLETAQLLRQPRVAVPGVRREPGHPRLRRPGRSLAAAARLACTPTSTSRSSPATCGSSSRPATRSTTWPRRTSGAWSSRTGCSRTAARAGTTPARTTTSRCCRTATTSPTRSPRAARRPAPPTT